MKKAIKRLLYPFVLQIMGVMEGKRRTRLIDAVAHIARFGFNPATVIDVGVADGTYELYQSFPKSKFLLVEPIKEFEDSLKAICKRYDAIYKIAAATSQNETTFINIAPDLDGSSILKSKESYVDCKVREVPAVRIDNLVDELGLKEPFLLKVDAEGGEIHVLRGAVRTMKLTEVIILEVSLFQFAEDEPQFFDIVAFLKQKGFVVYDIVGHSYRPLDNALAQVDIVFVKENGMFRASHLFASPEQHVKQFTQPDNRFKHMEDRHVRR